MRLFAELLTHRFLHNRHARHAANHNYLVDFAAFQVGIS